MTMACLGVVGAQPLGVRAKRVRRVRQVRGWRALGGGWRVPGPGSAGARGRGSAPPDSLDERGSPQGSVANNRKQESLDSQVIDFPIHDFRILPRKGKFATYMDPPTMSRGTREEEHV